tara:strand:+ start:1711 stop:2487 length:777 start_codon:yes stop_codon:yes gene_type:complete
MSILEQATKPADRMPIVTICGDSGLGKTSLAATFPNPIVIRAEDGLQGVPAAIRPDALPVVTSLEQLIEQMTALYKEEHKYKTIIIDSVTALERIFMQNVIDSDPKKPKSINQALGGYGAGLGAVATLHHRVGKLMSKINADKNIAIVYIAHADTETIELPDMDPYTRYNLRLGKRSVAPYVDDVDMVGFLKLQTYTSGDGDKKKATSDGSRLLVTYATASNVSKNRYGITDNIFVPKNENPLAQYIPALAAYNKEGK